ncbi:MAG TPA: anti-sigma factor [Streptosporangiaceae bacterium]|nr:anti-sigma factor [Streptosporangiaceae bacterium]
MTFADPHTLAGAYALDALTNSDRTAFERHIRTCDPCRQEAASLREAATRLGTAAAAAPPPRLREAVLAQAKRTRQVSPLRGGAGAGARGRSGWQLAPRLAVALAGLFILLVLGAGGLILSTQHRLGEELARGTAVAEVLTAPDATMFHVNASDGGSATVVMSHAKRALVLTTASLRALPGTERYEVWLMGPAGARSAGMLPVPRHGMTSPVVVTGLLAGERLGVTVEPAAGTPQPSAHPVIMVALPD